MFYIAMSSAPPDVPESLSPEGKDFLRLCLCRNPKDRADAATLLKHPFVAESEIDDGTK